MTKFRNKKTKRTVEVDLSYYIHQLRKNPNFEEIKDEPSKKDNKDSENKSNL